MYKYNVKYFENVIRMVLLYANDNDTSGDEFN